MISITILVFSLFGIGPAVLETILPAQVAGSPAAASADAGPGDAKASGSGAASTSDPGAPVAPVGTDDTQDAAEPVDTENSDAESASANTEGIWASVNKMLHSGAMGLMLEGGIFMWPILLMGIVAFAVIIERYRSLRMLGTDTQALRSQVRILLEQERVEEALQLCDGLQGPVPAILSAGLRKFLVLQRLDYDPAKIEEQVVKGMDDYGVHVVAALEKHLPVLGTVSSAAPMVGFLGTVSGMVNSFKDIVAKMGESNIVEAAAGGISEALLTTALGLIVGIPAYVAFNYFTSVINVFVLEVEESATELIETVSLQMALQQREAEGAVVADSSVR
jgi:biopolymer transport protein ExbB